MLLLLVLVLVLILVLLLVLHTEKEVFVLDFHRLALLVKVAFSAR